MMGCKKNFQKKNFSRKKFDLFSSHKSKNCDCPININTSPHKNCRLIFLDLFI